MQRRTFIKNNLLLGAGAALGAAFLPTSQKELVFGQNEKRYTLDVDWAQANPQNVPVKDCHEMVQDVQKRIVLLTNDTRNNVIFFNQNGKAVQTWGTEFPGAHGLSIWGEEEQFLYITDTERHQFYKTTLNGQVLKTWDAPLESGKYKAKSEFLPTETAVTENGEIYVADGYGAQYISHYDSGGKLKNIFGGRGSGAEHFDNAHGICIDTRGATPTLLITDRTRSCFKRFSMAGQYLGQIDLPGACVCRPVIKGDYLYTAVLRSPSMGKSDSGFVLILDKENKVVSVIGGAEAAYDAQGKLRPFYQTMQLFKHPHDVLVDDDENLYVCQWDAGQVYPYRFRPVQ